MIRSPVTARIVIAYREGGKLSTALIEDVYGRRRPLFSCPHGQVVAKIARWTEDNDFDHCEIRCERKPSSGTADAASSQSEDSLRE
jgi:hypothetical protein